MTNDRGIATDNATAVRVAVGGGNVTVQHYTFEPQMVEIDAGESVTWYSPTEFNELHTVTFVQDFNLTSDIILPFDVPESTEFELLPPFNIGEPLTMETPNGTAAVIALNKLTFYPAVADSNGNITYLNGTNIQYTMDGSEKALNCGIIQQPFPPAPENETATGGTMEIPQEESMNATTTATSNTTEMLVTEEKGGEVTEPHLNRSLEDRRSRL
jgi:hypothetical protein